VPKGAAQSSGVGVHDHRRPGAYTLGDVQRGSAGAVLGGALDIALSYLGLPVPGTAQIVPTLPRALLAEPGPAGPQTCPHQRFSCAWRGTRPKGSSERVGAGPT